MEYFTDHQLVRIHFIIEMISWTGLAPREFEFCFPGSLICTFHRVHLSSAARLAHQSASPGRFSTPAWTDGHRIHPPPCIAYPPALLHIICSRRFASSFFFSLSARYSSSTEYAPCKRVESGCFRAQGFEINLQTGGQSPKQGGGASNPKP